VGIKALDEQADGQNTKEEKLQKKQCKQARVGKQYP